MAPDTLKAIASKLRSISQPLDCGCSPCSGDCRSKEALIITVEVMQDLAAEALALMEAAEPRETIPVDHWAQITRDIARSA